MKAATLPLLACAILACLAMAACSVGAPAVNPSPDVKTAAAPTKAAPSATAAPATASPTPTQAPTATPEPTPTPTPVPPALGADGGNLLNGGSWCLREGVLYGMSGISTGKAAIYAQRPDGDIKLADGIGSQLNAAGGYLYYLSYPEGKPYRVPLDGSAGPVKLSDQKMTFLLVAGESIYYTDDPGAALHVMKTDGAGEMKLSDGKCYDVGGYGSLLYYTDMKSKTFCMLDVLSGNATAFPMENRGFAQVMGTRVYYQNENDGKRLHSCNLDGSDDRVLFDGAVTALNATEDALFFANKADKGKVYRMNLDGSGVVKAADIKAAFITVCGSELYIVSDLKTAAFYRMDESGQLTRLK